MTDGLHERDVRVFTDLAYEIGWMARTEPRHLTRWIISRLADVVPSDAVWRLQSRFPRNQVVHVDADDSAIAALRNSDGGREAWRRLVDEHPLRRRRAHDAGEVRALRNSDLSSQTEFRRLESHAIFFRPFGLNYVATVRYRGPRAVFDLVCGRGRVDFSDRDLLLLDLFAAVVGPAVRDPAPALPRSLAELGLTQREGEVLERAARGRSNHEIAADLSIAVGTVKKHLDNVFAKLGVRNRIEATRAWLDATPE